MNAEPPRARNIIEELAACSKGDPRIFKEFHDLTRYEMYMITLLGT